MKTKIIRLFSILLTTDKKMSLEYRLFFSAITVTIFITLVAVILGTVLTVPRYLLITGYVLLAILLVMNYYMRYKKIIQPFIYIYVFTAILANAALWMFGGGLDSQNLILLIITLILSLIIVPKKTWILILAAYIALVLIQFHIQKFRPELISGYPSELSRWIDGLTTTLYSIVFLFFIVQFLLKNYSFERAKAEKSEMNLQNLNKTLESRIEEKTRELTKAKLEAEIANNAKSRFLLNIGHEFRTPLNAVIGYAELIESDDGRNSKEYANSIKSSGRRLLDMVNNILELIRTEKAEIELEYDYVDVQSFFREFEFIFSSNIAEKKLRFRTIIDENLPGLIYTDEKRLRLAITNLIDNAIKFTQKGEVELSVYQNKNQSGDKEKTHLLIEIKDTGTGIPEQDQKIIFEAFSQIDNKTSTSGIGIGLSLTHLIISKMNGNIKVISQPGMGSRFIITLPDIVFKKGGKPFYHIHENATDVFSTKSLI
jgi:signal transduction histidine kinase